MDTTLTVAQVAARCGWTKSRADRFVAAWFAAQATHPLAPRVTKPRRPKTRGRRAYAIDIASLERWLRQRHPQNTDAVANDAAPASASSNAA